MRRAALAALALAAAFDARPARAGDPALRPWHDAGVLGVRVGFGATSGAGPQAGVSFAAATDAEVYARRGLLSMRSASRAWAGGGDPGFDGGLGLSLGAGLRAPVAKKHGPILRGAVRADVEGNDASYFSLFELPQAQLGWQYQDGLVVAEAALTTGLALAGRFRAGDAAMRVLGDGLAFGGYVALQLAHLRLALVYENLPTDDLVLRGPLERLDVRACFVFAPLALCADGRLVAGAGLPAGQPEREVASGAWGLTLGLSRER